MYGDPVGHQHIAIIYTSTLIVTFMISLHHVILILFTCILSPDLQYIIINIVRLLFANVFKYRTVKNCGSEINLANCNNSPIFRLYLQ